MGEGEGEVAGGESTSAMLAFSDVALARPATTRQDVVCCSAGVIVFVDDAEGKRTGDAAGCAPASSLKLLLPAALPICAYCNIFA